MQRGIILKIKSGQDKRLTRSRHITGLMTWVVLVAGLFLHPATTWAAELQTRYATIHYESERQLHELNRKLRLSGNLAYLLDGRKIITVHDEVAAKIDIVMDKVQIVLEMFPDKLAFKLLLFSTAEGAQAELFKRYRKKVNFISFYSRRENTLYLSAQHSELKVIAHELGHVVVEHYFDKSTPAKIHEVMAQYAVRHITD